MGGQAELFETVPVRGHSRRKPRKPADTRLLLADTLRLLAEIPVPRRDETARRYYGVRARLREAVRP